MAELINLLEREYYSFDVGQLVDVINEALADSVGEANGADGADGMIFFESDATLAFPSSDVGYVEMAGWRGDGGISGAGDLNNGINGNINGGIASSVNRYSRAVVGLPVMNILGSSSPLPVSFSDYIARNRQDADIYRDFLSIMQNRIHRLWLDAHRKYALWSNGGRVARMIFESMSALPIERAGFYENALAGLGQLSNRARSAQGLKDLLRTTWDDIPIRIEENVGRWAQASNAPTLGGAMRVGKNASVGSRVYDRTSKFRISLGPLAYSAYKTFLPGGANYRLISGIIALYLNEPILCELEISCRREDMPKTKIGGAPPTALGRTTILGRGEGACRYRADVTGAGAFCAGR
ncbi:MAG: type VI secretion system baseplate subunit TssG [Chitinispirillales bacterium]|nr:type VI secretion system baseplate subunit TssG [Chitinispirillales bacterium]